MLWIACSALDAEMKRLWKRNLTKKFQFWLHHNHLIELSTNEILQKRLDYFRNNPVEASFVENPSDWLYCSARDYKSRKV